MPFSQEGTSLRPGLAARLLQGPAGSWLHVAQDLRGRGDVVNRKPMRKRYISKFRYIPLAYIPQVGYIYRYMN